MAEVPRVDRYRLGPPEAGEHEGQRAEGIDVRQRVQGDASEPPRGRVPEAIGDQRVGELVHGHRDQQGRQLEDQAKEVAERIAEEIAHPPRGAPDSGGSDSVDSSGPATR